MAVNIPCSWSCTALQPQPGSKRSVVQLHAEQSVPALRTVQQSCSRLVPCVHFSLLCIQAALARHQLSGVVGSGTKPPYLCPEGLMHIRHRCPLPQGRWLRVGPPAWGSLPPRPRGCAHSAGCALASLWCEPGSSVTCRPCSGCCPSPSLAAPSGSCGACSPSSSQLLLLGAPKRSVTLMCVTVFSFSSATSYLNIPLGLYEFI